MTEINILHLLWIVPLSMVVGMVALLCIACIVVKQISEEERLEALMKIEEEEMNRRIKERYDNRNA